MEKLKEYASGSRAKDLAAVVRKTDAPGGGGTKLTMSKPACYRLALAGRVADDFAKMSRTLACADLVNIFSDPDLLEAHKTQILLERDHDNAPALEFFKPVTEKIAKSKGWRHYDEQINLGLAQTRGILLMYS